MTKRCPTCGGSGKVPWVPPTPGAYAISPWPTEMCRTCSGSGWYDKALANSLVSLLTFEMKPDEPTEDDFMPGAAPPDPQEK